MASKTSSGGRAFPDRLIYWVAHCVRLQNNFLKLFTQITPFLTQVRVQNTHAAYRSSPLLLCVFIAWACGGNGGEGFFAVVAPFSLLALCTLGAQRRLNSFLMLCSFMCLRKCTHKQSLCCCIERRVNK